MGKKEIKKAEPKEGEAKTRTPAKGKKKEEVREIESIGEAVNKDGSVGEEVSVTIVPKDTVVLINPAGDINIVYKGREYSLRGGEQRIFKKDVASFLRERYPFLKVRVVSSDMVDVIAQAESKPSPFIRTKPKKRSTFDPLEDTKVGLIGEGVQDDVVL